MYNINNYDIICVVLYSFFRIGWLYMIVGYTGFVGSNLCLSHRFEYLINSKNIESAFGKAPDTLIYSGVPAEMFIANNFPEKDKEIIENAKSNIKKINPRRVVLISTVAVYDCTKGVDEDHEPDLSKLTKVYFLDISHNKLTDVSEIAKMKNLQQLNLSGNTYKVIVP